MASERQRNSNAVNAMRSTGPTSPPGKKMVATNALTHGLQSNSIRLFWESEEDFDAFKKAI